MKIRNLVMLSLIGLAGVACKNADDTCLVVPTTAPVNLVNLKFINKNTGADLIFGPGAPYKLSDLQVTSSNRGYKPPLIADTAQKNNPVIVMMVEGKVTQNLYVT